MDLITFWEKTKEFFKNNWVSIVFGIIIIVLILCLCKSCQSYKDLKNISDHNIVALTDSVKYYKGKNGELVAEKTLLIGDMETLELANAELAKKVEDMKVKDPDAVVDVDVIVDNGTHDTTWIVKHDLDTTIIKQFNFDNEFRELNGNITLNADTLGLNVENDKVFAEVTTVIKDGKVYVTSDNPYLTITDANGITVPETEPSWCLVVGPSIGFGYDPVGNARMKSAGDIPVAPTIGISLTFGWNIKGVGRRVRR